LFDKTLYMKDYNQRHYLEQQNWRKAHPERTLAARERFKLKHLGYFQKKQKEYKKRIDVYNLNYNAINKEKRKAEATTQYEPLAERCEICADSRHLVHHHPDYSFPRFFVTLCSSCHNHVHQFEAKT